MRSLVAVSKRLITGPTIEPLDLEETKKALKIVPTTEDTLIDSWISAARQQFELDTDRQIMAATREITWLGTPNQRELELPYPPFLEVVSLTVDGDEVDEDLYTVVPNLTGPAAPPARLRLRSGSLWPTASELVCTYRCGYGSTLAAVPELVRSTLYLLVGHFHKERSEARDGTITSIPLGYESRRRLFRDSALPVLGDVFGTPATWV